MPRGKVEVSIERCKGCGLCIEVCPQDVLSFSGEYNASGYEYVTPSNAARCTGCTHCAMQCPDVAITVFRRVKEGA